MQLSEGKDERGISLRRKRTQRGSFAFGGVDPESTASGSGSRGGRTIETEASLLSAPQGQLSHGLRFYSGQGFPHEFVTGFSSPNNSLSWTTHPHATARYEATVLYRGPRGANIQLALISTRTRISTNPSVISHPHRVQNANQAPVMHWSRLRLGALSLPSSPTTLKLHMTALPAISKPLNCGVSDPLAFLEMRWLIAILVL